jgi:type IV pilus assembly protein PilE
MGRGARGTNNSVKHQAGFTLVELMIVVVVVAVLAGIALPAYQDSVRKARRSDAKAGLFAVAGRQEQFMLDRGSYTIDMKDLGYAETASMTTDDEHYTIAAIACTSGVIANCYQLTATPIIGSPQTADAYCTSFGLDSRGTKSATGSADTECW